MDKDDIFIIDDDLIRAKECDGCNQMMDMATYQAHECPAYAYSKHKNPLAHKMSKAVWMTPKGKLVAKGRALTQADIAKVQNG